MKSMQCLFTGCYFISMGTTDVAVNLIYERAPTEDLRLAEGVITALPVYDGGQRTRNNLL